VSASIVSARSAARSAAIGQPAKRKHVCSGRAFIPETCSGAGRLKNWPPEDIEQRMTSPDGRPPSLRLRPSAAAGKTECRSMVAGGVGRRARRAVSKQPLRLKARGNHAGLVHVGPLHLLFFVGILEVRLSNALADGGIPCRVSWAKADDAKPAMESATSSVRRYVFVCFMVLLLDAFPSGIRDPALSKGCRAPCKYATLTHLLARRRAQQTSRRRDA
jgi:hypothetical protein